MRNSLTSIVMQVSVCVIVKIPQIWIWIWVWIIFITMARWVLVGNCEPTHSQPWFNKRMPFSRWLRLKYPTTRYMLMLWTAYTDRDLLLSLQQLSITNLWCNLKPFVLIVTFLAVSFLFHLNDSLLLSTTLTASWLLRRALLEVSFILICLLNSRMRTLLILLKLLHH